MNADRPFIESRDASNLLRSLQDLIRPAILVLLYQNYASNIKSMLSKSFIFKV